jgi:hypothetical protein
MSLLKAKDRVVLEKFFDMGGGYVCDFSDRTFAEFLLESVDVDVYASGYEEGGTSKANRLRTFWRNESNVLIARLIEEMCDYWRTQLIHSESFDQKMDQLYQESLKIAENLKSENSVEDLDAIKSDSSDITFHLLAKSIRESVSKGEANQALDRLHTFMMRYARTLCDKHKLKYTKTTRLNILFRAYVKHLESEELVDAEMSKRIMNSLASILDTFDLVRNNHSLAHDNPILNLDESFLIINTIASILRFIESKERKLVERKELAEEKTNWDEIHFTEEEIEAAADAYAQHEIDMRRGK